MCARYRVIANIQAPGEYGMKRIEKGDFVKLCYTGMLDNGTVFDKTEKCKPLEIQVGAGTLVAGFESALIGMAENERKSFVLEPDEGYGERDENLERSFERSSLPLTFQPRPGQVIIFSTEDGQQLPAMVKFVDEEVLLVDFNHPLAGKSLTFEVEVAEIGGKPGESPAACSQGCCCS
jgi:peptidylprolyl isomerase